MGIDMDTSRERFDEAAAMVLDALETRVLRGDGPYYPRPETPIRPRPSRSSADRLLSVAMSPDPVLPAAALGAQMLLLSQRPCEDQAGPYRPYRTPSHAPHHPDPTPLPPPAPPPPTTH